VQNHCEALKIKNMVYKIIDEYIVINKKKLEERLEVLEIVEAQQVGNLNEHIARGERKALENILSSNSTKLTLLLENSFNEAREYRMKNVFKHDIAKDYINNLKLDI